jgi:hypothetical protein
MKNKQILTTLVNIAHNQQLMLKKLADATTEPYAAEKALGLFIRYQLVSWGLSNEVAAKTHHSIERVADSKHFTVNVTLTLTDKNKKGVAEDPAKGFAAWLHTKFNEAASDPNSKWKNFAGYTAQFNVTAN